MPMASRAMALVNWFCPTSWGISAWRAGMKKENTAPCIIEAASRWYQVTVPVLMETATNRAMRPAPTWPSWMMRFRCRRSAMAPPNSASISMGRAKPAETIPSNAGEFVRS